MIDHLREFGLGRLLVCGVGLKNRTINLTRRDGCLEFVDGLIVIRIIGMGAEDILSDAFDVRKQTLCM